MEEKETQLEGIKTSDQTGRLEIECILTPVLLRTNGDKVLVIEIPSEKYIIINKWFTMTTDIGLKKNKTKRLLTLDYAMQSPYEGVIIQ